jgi:hypothetical protein
MSDIHDDDPEDDNRDDDDDCDDDGGMRLEEPSQASRQWHGSDLGSPGLGRGGKRTDIFGSNLAGRKPAASSLAAYASSGSHTKVQGFTELWGKQAAKRLRAQEEATAGRSAGAAEEGILPSPTILSATPLAVDLDRGSESIVTAMMDSIKLNLAETVASTVHRDIIPALRGAIDDLLRQASTSIEAATKKATDEIQVDRELLSVHTQLAVLKSDLVAVLPKGNVICLVCTENIETIVDPRMLRSKWVASNGGVNVDSRLVQTYNEHIASDIHRLCLECAQGRLRDPLRKAHSLLREREKSVMKTLLKAVSYANLHHQSLRMHEHFVQFLASESVDVGDCGHSRHTAKDLSVVLAECAQEKMRLFLCTVNPMTGRKPHLGIAADKLTDKGKVQSQIVMARVNYAGNPLTFLATLAPLSLTYDPEHEASGLACFNQICEIVEREFGIGLFDVISKNEHGDVAEWGDSILVQGHSEQWRSTAADGEGVYNGSGAVRSVKARIHGEHGLNDRTHCFIWDIAHSADLLIEDAHSEAGNQYVKEIVHPLIKEVYSFFSQSPHHQRRLDLLAEDWGAEDLVRKITYLFEVRFVASEFAAIKNFLIDLPVILSVLKEELDLVDISAEKREKLVRWIRTLRQFKFVAYLIVMLDIEKVMKVLSETAQSDELLIIDVPTFREATKLSLTLLLTSLGSEATRRLPSLLQGKLVMTETGAGIAGRELTVTDDDGAIEVVGELQLISASGNVKQRLLSYQSSFVRALLKTFDSRIVDSKLAKSLRTIMDFRTMPLHKSAAEDAELLEWSNDVIDVFLPEYFPELDVATFKDEALAARIFVRDHATRFMQPKDPKDASKGVVLALTGPGSVFEVLFSRSDMCSKPIPSFLHVADYMISIMWQSCCGERAGSHVNLVKTEHRTGLEPDILSALCYNSFNMPPLHQMDFDPCIEKWREDGRRMGVFKGDTGKDASKVVARLHMESKRTFLYTNGSPYIA